MHLYICIHIYACEVLCDILPYMHETTVLCTHLHLFAVINCEMLDKVGLILVIGVF